MLEMILLISVISVSTYVYVHHNSLKRKKKYYTDNDDVIDNIFY
jgi:hypothetical protein